MATIVLPEAVKGLVSATVKRWVKQPGEAVAPGDFIVELETESALIHLEAKAAGVLSKVAVPAGKTVAVGTVLGEIAPGSGGTGVAVTAKAAPAAATPATAKPAAVAPASGEAPGTGGAAVPILMPQAGNTMEEGTVIAWKVREGDTLQVGQIICEIETDKATIEFESPVAGRLARIVVPPGGVAPVKTPIAFVGEGAIDMAAPATSPPSPGASDLRQVPVAGGDAPVAAVAAGSAGQAVPILMPQAGNTMEEGTILAWKVKEGDALQVGQIICEIETDKATMEFESPVAGRLAKIVVAEGAVAPVKTPIAFVGEGAIAASQAPARSDQGASPRQPAKAPSGGAAAQTASAREQAAGTGTAVAPAGAGGRIKASPAARKIAAQQGVDLSTVATGSGPGGRILSSDVLKAPRAAAATPATAGPERRPLSKMRRAIALNLQASKQTIPHFYVRMTINADPMFAYYRARKPATGCTINDVILLAVGRGLAAFPALRSRLDGNDLVQLPAANVGVAVGVEDGLVVPVVTGVDRMTLQELAAASKRVVENARVGKLENLGKGVFTVTNLGMFGVEDFQAIINPPESGILAVSAVRESVLVKDGALRPAKVMTLTVSVDHRVVDGVVAAQFLGKLKELLESPQLLEA